MRCRLAAAKFTEAIDIAARAAGRRLRPTELRRTAIRSVMLFSLVLFIAMVARAQDPLNVDPAHYKVEFENDQIQVVRVHFGPHYRSVMNQTPARVVVVLKDEHFKVTYPDGTSSERHLKAGTTFWDEGGGKGIPENLSDEPFELIWVVPKAQSTSEKGSGNQPHD